MQDPSISRNSPQPPTTSASRPPFPTPGDLEVGGTLPCPIGSRADSRAWVEPVDVRGFVVVSGTGEELGRVLGIECDRHGLPKWLSFVEDGGSEPRKVQLRFIRRFGNGRVELAGPREGYHITRLGHPPY